MKNFFAILAALATLWNFFLERYWRGVGRREANEEANEEEQRRIDIAKAARADHDQFSSGELRDPRQRD